MDAPEAGTKSFAWMLPGWRLDGWGAFAVWALVGALFSLSVLGAASIGIFVFPFALLALLGAGLGVRVWPAILGLLEGVAALSLFVGIANLGSTPCPSRGFGSAQSGGGTGGSMSCGGLDPVPWLVVGVALAGIGFVAYPLARTALGRRPHPPA